VAFQPGIAPGACADLLAVPQHHGNAPGTRKAPGQQVEGKVERKGILARHVHGIITGKRASARGPERAIRAHPALTVAPAASRGHIGRMRIRDGISHGAALFPLLIGTRARHVPGLSGH